MKNITKILLAGLIILVLALGIITIANANGNIPDGIELFDYQDMNGNWWFCVMEDTGEFKDCYSCCNNNCNLTTVEKETVAVKETTIPNTLVPIPTIKPIPPKPETTDKCNNGGGNGIECKDYIWNGILWECVECDPNDNPNANDND